MRGDRLQYTRFYSPYPLLLVFALFHFCLVLASKLSLLWLLFSCFNSSTWGYGLCLPVITKVFLFIGVTSSLIIDVTGSVLILIKGIKEIASNTEWGREVVLEYSHSSICQSQNIIFIHSSHWIRSFYGTHPAFVGRKQLFFRLVLFLFQTICICIFLST